ncbi:MAG TPA: DPP IV N-terminal domain-containing protein, partial [Caldilineaceae bacterium]|nr:DPP IV N-terminal domain-containing protein [Caldilineaceae bacterium]
QRTPVEREIFVVNADGSGLTNLTNQPGFDMEPVWSPDGQQIAFTSTRAGDGYMRSLYIMAADASNQQLLVENAEQPAWSPGGDAIAFVRDGQIFLFKLAGGQTTQLTTAVSPSAQATANSGPVWSPDGELIAFVSNRDGNAEIYRMKADGSEQTNLTNQPGYEATPVWSPDGAWIAFTSDGSAEPGIYVMQSAGGPGLKVTAGAISEFLPTWSPDSNWLAFVSDPEVQIIVRANIQEVMRVGRVIPEAISTGGDTFPVWTP